MIKKIASVMILTLLLVSMLTLAFNVQPVKASGTIYIKADGRVVPSTANIATADNVTYYFTDNNYDEIVVERSNIIIDGNVYTLSAYNNGFYLQDVNNVTIINTNIRYCWHGIWLSLSSFITISGNKITNCDSGILLESSDYNDISGNAITDNSYRGVGLENSFFNTVYGNAITNNTNYGVLLVSSDYNDISGNAIIHNTLAGIYLLYSFFNTVSGNAITNNYEGVRLLESDSNLFYHNNFVDNSEWQIHDIGPFNGLPPSDNFWDDGYPSGGNYWSDYLGPDEFGGPNQDETGSDGIGDQPYVIDENNADYYPLMNPWPYNVTIKAHCNTDHIDVSVSIIMDGSPTPYTTPHTFTGLTGTHTFTVPNTDPNGHPFYLWNTGERNTTITVTSARTYTAYYGIYIYDVAVTDVTFSKTVVGQGYCMNITVTVENQGILKQTFGVVAPYFDGVVIPTPEQWETFWSMGDCSRDGYIDLTDLAIIHENWAWYGPPGENPADINSDGSVDIYDQVIWVVNQGLDIWTYYGLPVPPKGTQRGVRLHPGSQTTITFTWNTTGMPKGNYIISAYIAPVPGETDLSDNTFIDGWIFVTISGDVDGDRDVDIYDVVKITGIYDSKCGDPQFNPNSDLDNDGEIKIYDVVRCTSHYGQSW